MTEPNSSKKKPVRYMDFISKKPEANSDPLASRPAARPVKKPEKVEKVHSVADQIPPKGAHQSAPKAFISRKPAESRDLYPEPKPEPAPKPAPKSEPIDDLAIKASAAFSGTSKPAEKSSPDNNAYSLSGKSPFLPNYSVDKRPLSNSVPEKKKDANFEKLSFLGVNEPAQETGRHKNIYKKSEKKKADKPEAPEAEKTVKVIDDTNKKRGIPTWLVIVLTILLGAAVGAGVYFLLPK